MNKKQVIDYVMNTPGNTNKMVLEGMLGDTDGVKLPEISEEDEGKVLTVIDGKWDKGVASGGDTEPLIVRAQSFVNDGSTATLTYDKTWQQIHDAIANGVPCYFGVSSNSMCSCSQVEDLPDVMLPIYEAFTVDDEETMHRTYELSSAAHIQINMESPTAPLVTSTDCGGAA